MSKSRILIGLSALTAAGVFVAGAAVAEDAIAKRKGIMKAVGKATKTTGAMVKGEVKFDAAAAKANMDTIAKSWADFAKLFPKGTETGGKTTASAKVWTNFKEFDDKGKKMAADAAKASAAAAKGADAFKVAFGAVTKNCKGCHETFRVKKK